ncbi:MAG: hypothetical protein HY331_13210 [Chloroflexi bacterium]|nr:hypothetical protein [Chloroflexota bacterium]
MRKLGVVLALVLVLLMAMAVPAFAHVHGITPLSECSVDNPNSGANAAQGGPITGLIVRDVASSPLDVGDGGRNAPVQCP